MMSKKSKLFSSVVWEDTDDEIRSISATFRYRLGSRLTKKLQSFVYDITLDVTDKSISTSDITNEVFTENDFLFLDDGLYELRLSYKIATKEIIDFYVDMLYSKQDARAIMKSYGFKWKMDMHFKEAEIECFCGSRSSSPCAGKLAYIDRKDLSTYGRHHLNPVQKVNVADAKVFVPLNWVRETTIIEDPEDGKFVSAWSMPKEYMNSKVECPFCGIASRVDDSYYEAVPLRFRLLERLLNFPSKKR